MPGETPYNFSLRSKYTGQGVSLIHMPKVGVEPTRGCPHAILSRTRPPASAERESRTPMRLPPQDFESCASTSSAISAKAGGRHFGLLTISLITSTNGVYPVLGVVAT